jgi:probable HAF family extracellular repeat protein
MTDLGTIYDLPNSLAASINNQGQVVGFSQDLNGDISSTVAWIWQDGVMTDLNTLIPAKSPYFLIEALSINDRGQIAGFMFDSSTGVAPGFVATPVEGQEGEAAAALDGTSEEPRPVLPENVRRMLERRRNFFGHVFSQ